jgi:hypothetical protein
MDKFVIRKDKRKREDGEGEESGAAPPPAPPPPKLQPGQLKPEVNKHTAKLVHIFSALPRHARATCSMHVRVRACVARPPLRAFR